MFPTSILRAWITGLLAIALLGGGGYMIWEWYEGDADREYLWWGIGLLAFSFLGQFVFLPFLGSWRFGEPRATRDGTRQRIKRSDGTELHVEFYGPADAQPIVFTHGWSLNSTVWYYAKRTLAEKYRLIVWDLPGLGLSTEPRTKDYSLEKMAADLEAVIGVAGRPVILVGHSIGGMISLTFCRMFPQQVARQVAGLVLIGTTYKNPVTTAALAPVWTAIQKPVIEPLLHLTVWLSPLVRWMNFQSYMNGTTQMQTRFTSFAGRQTIGQVDFVSRLSSFASPAVSARGMLALLRFNEEQTLKNIHVPTLVIAGENDRAVRKYAGEHISRQIPGAQLLVLEPAGHQSILEQHDAVIEAVGTFTAEHGTEPPAAASERSIKTGQGASAVR